MSRLEKLMADRVLRAIEIDNKSAVEKFYIKYLNYTRTDLKDFDKDMQNEIMFKYAEYITKDI